MPTYQEEDIFDPLTSGAMKLFTFRLVSDRA